MYVYVLGFLKNVWFPNREVFYFFSLMVRPLRSPFNGTAIKKQTKTFFCCKWMFTLKWVCWVSEVCRVVNNVDFTVMCVKLCDFWVRFLIQNFLFHNVLRIYKSVKTIFLFDSLACALLYIFNMYIYSVICDEFLTKCRLGQL